MWYQKGESRRSPHRLSKLKGFPKQLALKSPLPCRYTAAGGDMAMRYYFGASNSEVPMTTETGLMAMCGGRYAIVPANVLKDKSLSRSARWLFAMLCGHADIKGHLQRSLERIAEQEDVTVRSVHLWMGELEKAGLVVKLNEAGKKCEFQVIRHPKARPAAREQNAYKILKRRLEFGVYGRKGAPERARQRAAAAAEPVNSISPPPEQHFTGTGVNVVSPKQELKTRKEEQELKQAVSAECDITEESTGTATAELTVNDGASGQKVCLQGVEGGQAQAERQHLESRNGAEKELKADDFAKLRRKIAQAHGRDGGKERTRRPACLTAA